MEKATTHDTSRRKLLWPLVLITLAVVGVTVALFVYRARRQSAAIAVLDAIEEVGIGDVGQNRFEEFSSNIATSVVLEPRGPAWWRSLLGEERARAWWDRPVEVNLYGTTAGDDDLQQVLKLPTVRRVWLGRGNRISPAGLRELARLPALRSLDLSGLGVTDEGFREVSRLDQLEELSLGDAAITDEGLAPIGRLFRLVRLNLSGTAITDASIGHLCKLLALKWLNLSGTQQLRGDRIARLSVLPNLQTLILLETRFETDGVWQLGEIKTLTTLHLDRATLHDGDLRQIGHAQRLRLLTLSGTGLTDGDLFDLDDVRQLEELDLSFTKITAAGLTHLKGLTRLKKLNLRGTPITEQDVQPLRQAIPGLEIVGDFSSNAIAAP